jgi:hypothetical protein
MTKRLVVALVAVLVFLTGCADSGGTSGAAPVYATCVDQPAH